MRVLALAFLLLPTLAACSMVGDNDSQLVDLGIETEEEYRDKRDELVKSLDDAIGDASATDAASCQVVNIGQKACGGPVEYRVFSTTDGDTQAILDLAEQITQLDADANTEFGLASTCDVPVPPTPMLSEGRCVAQGFSISGQ